MRSRNGIRKLLKGGAIEKLFIRGNKTVSAAELQTIGKQFGVNIVCQWPPNQGAL